MLVALFVITLVVTMFGRLFDVDAGLATGLSLKNFLLFISFAAIITSITLRRIPANFPQSVFGPLWIGCAMAGSSILVISVFSIYSGYSSVDAVIKLKSKLLDPLLMLTISYFSVQTPRSAIALFRLITLIIVGGCVVTIIDVLDIQDLGLITQRDDGRVEGFIGSSEEFATIVAATLPILIVGTRWNSGYSKILMYFSILCMVCCLMLAATRAPIVGLLGAWLIYVLFLKRNRFMSLLRGISLFVPTIAVISFLLSFTPYWGLITDRFTTGFLTGNVAEASSGRSLIWEGIFLQMLNQPSSFFIGMGWDVYFQSVGHRFSTHSIFIDRFYSLGLFGLIAYLAAYWSAFRLIFTPSPTNADFLDSLRISAGLSLVVLLIDAMFADLEVAEFFILAFVGIGLRCTTFTESDFNFRQLRSHANGTARSDVIPYVSGARPKGF